MSFRIRKEPKPEPKTVPKGMFVHTAAYAQLWAEWRKNNPGQPYNQFIYDALDALEVCYQRRRKEAA